MKKMWWLGALLALPVALAGPKAAQPEPSGYICPLTGELLPCPDCCPLDGKADDTRTVSAVAEGTTMLPDTGEYICPLTGELLPCPDCCPAKRK